MDVDIALSALSPNDTGVVPNGTMVNKCIMSLSTSGVLTDPKSIMNKLLECYIVNDYSQSTTDYGKIKSLKKRLHETIDDNQIILDNIKADLSYLFGLHFKEFDIVVNLIIDEVTEKELINIDAETIVDSTTYSVKVHTGSSLNELKTQMDLFREYKK